MADWKACRGCDLPCQPKDGGTTMSLLACEQVRLEAEAKIAALRANPEPCKH
jgi:hypothetical protein